MIQPYKSNATKSGLAFVALNIIAVLWARQYIWLWLLINPVGRLFWVGIIISAFFWYYNYAKAKGYSGWFSLLGLFHLIGFIILLLLPDRTK